MLFYNYDLNKLVRQDHPLRKVLNDAIYPFYLLHQPALIFVGYAVLKWDISYGMQAFLITTLSLAFFLISYLFIIKFNFLRVVFGMKTKPKKQPLNEIVTPNSLALDK